MCMCICESDGELFRLFFLKLVVFENLSAIRKKFSVLMVRWTASGDYYWLSVEVMSRLCSMFDIISIVEITLEMYRHTNCQVDCLCT